MLVIVVEFNFNKKKKKNVSQGEGVDHASFALDGERFSIQSRGPPRQNV